MSGNIFPVKLFDMYTALKSTDLLGRMAQCAAHHSIPYPDDGKERILLNSPEVMKVVCKKNGLKDCRVRIAFPENPTFSTLSRDTTLELYSVEKTPLGKPVPLVDTDDELSNAIQVELLQRLLAAKGINIAML